MFCNMCQFVTQGDRCGNPGCESNPSQFECGICKTISPGAVCSNPACWNQKLIRNRYGGREWGELLAVLDSVTVQYIQGSRQRPTININLQNRIAAIQSPRGAHWLWLCSDKKGSSLNWVPAKIQLRPEGFVVDVLPQYPGVRVYFPKVFFDGGGDFRYFEIGPVFKQLGNDIAVAGEMLQRVRGGYNRPFGKDYDAFLDTMIVLLFGVESARNWATCATSLMLLELIANARTYGRGKVFTLAAAFHHETKKPWDDGNFYGGKHPMAVHGTGPDNLIDRGKIVGSKGVGWDRDVSTRPQHHAVVYRELSVLRHWLHFSDTVHGYSGLSVENRILRLLQTYFS